MYRFRRLLCAVFLLTLLASPGPVTALAPARAPAGTAPFLFIENIGQFAPGVRFQVRGAGRTLWLAEDGLWLTVREEGAPSVGPRYERRREEPSLRRAVHLRLSFAGANAASRLEPSGRLSTKVSYFRGSDPVAWRADVPVWGGVRYVGLYPGVDLELASEGGRLVQRLVAHGAAGAASLAQVRLQVEGAESLTLDAEKGCLRARTALGEVALPLLQLEGALPARGPALEGNTIVAPFALAGPRASASAVEDSGLLYATFLGGLGSDVGTGIAVDGSGQAYVVGHTEPADTPETPGASTPAYSEGDVFVVKLSATGTELVYATFLGGAGEDWSCDIAVDGAGHAYFCGDTTSTDLPTTEGAFAASHSGAWDAFVAKLNPDGTALAYSTYLGSSLTDWCEAIAVDGDGSAYVIGETESEDWPATPNAFGQSYKGGWDAYVAKLNAEGTALVYATFLGGSPGSVATGEDWGGDIAIDGAGQAYVTGTTGSRDFPVTDGAMDRTLNGGLPTPSDAFVAKLNADGSALIYSTFLGGTLGDWGEAIAVDTLGQAYVAGETRSRNFPVTPGAYDTSYNGSVRTPQDAFVAKLNAEGTGLVYATYYGGNDNEDCLGLAIDSDGNAYISGDTKSTDLPIVADAFDASHNGGSDAYVAKLSPDGAELVYATFLGGSADDWSEAIALDGAGQVYVTGGTDSADFPATPGAPDDVFAEGEAFVVKIAQEAQPPPPVLDKVVYLPLVLK